MTWRDDDELEMAVRRHASNPPRPDPQPARLTPLPAPDPGRDLGDVGPGWVLYDLTTDESALEAAGVCVDVVHDTIVSPDGEIIARTRYRCLRYWASGSRPVWTYIPAGAVDTSQGGFDPVTASAAARWLVKDLNRHRRRNRLADWEIDALVIAARLAAAVAQ